MPRHERLHYRGAFHIVTLKGRGDATLFYDPRLLPRLSQAHADAIPSIRLFFSLLESNTEQHGCRVHGYCVCPNRTLLIVQTLGAPLTWVMRPLCGQLSQRLHALGLAPSGAAFGSRFESRILAPELLPHAVRRAHVLPVLTGLVKHRIDYPFSSDRTYQGEPGPSWLTTEDVLRFLQLRGRSGLRGYRQFMDEPEKPYITKFFTRGSRWDPRIVGDRDFVENVHDFVERLPPLPDREQLVLAVATLIGQTPQHIYSSARAGAFGRALVAAHATRLGVATLGEVGRWFSVTGNALRYGIQRHKRLRPELFDPPQGELAADSPLLILRGVS